MIYLVMTLPSLELKLVLIFPNLVSPLDKELLPSVNLLPSLDPLLSSVFDPPKEFDPPLKELPPIESILLFPTEFELDIPFLLELEGEHIVP